MWKEEAVHLLPILLKNRSQNKTVAFICVMIAVKIKQDSEDNVSEAQSVHSHTTRSVTRIKNQITCMSVCHGISGSFF